MSDVRAHPEAEVRVPPLRRAAFHVRVAALLIDLFLVALILHACALVDVYLNQSTSLNYIGMVTWAGLAVAVALLAGMEVFQAATPGKRVMKLVIAPDVACAGAAADTFLPPRSALLKRAFVKYAPALFIVFPLVMFCAADPTAPWRLHDYVRGVAFALGTVDAVVTACITIYALVGCFRARKPDGLAFHDLAAGTAVYRSEDLPRGRGFTPVVEHDGNEPVGAPSAGSSIQAPAAAATTVDRTPP